MAKVLLVEDDNNLREIFEMRLQAEGYETLSAGDGEEALVVATREKPDLIIADVMMPKLSGFEMLETLRAAPDIGNVKVIMMTALGQAEDRARGDKLGVVKYLVKSQVTLEDFVRVVREVLPPSEGTKASPSDPNNGKVQGNSSSNNQERDQKMQNDNTPTDNASADPAAGASNPIAGSDASGTAAGGADDQLSSAQQQSVVNDQVNNFAANADAGATGAGTPAAGDTSAPAGDSNFPPASPPTDGGTQPPVEEPKPEDNPPTPPAASSGTM